MFSRFKHLKLLLGWRPSFLIPPIRLIHFAPEISLFLGGLTFCSSWCHTGTALPRHHLWRCGEVRRWTARCGSILRSSSKSSHRGWLNKLSTGELHHFSIIGREFTSLLASYMQDLQICREGTVPNWHALPPRFVEESGRMRSLAARKVSVGPLPEVASWLKKILILLRFLLKLDIPKSCWGLHGEGATILLWNGLYLSKFFLTWALLDPFACRWHVTYWKIWLILLMEEPLHHLICGLSHYLQGFLDPRWCRISSINSIYTWSVPSSCFPFSTCHWHWYKSCRCERLPGMLTWSVLNRNLLESKR